jgi:hypothetical protein
VSRKLNVSGLIGIFDEHFDESFSLVPKHRAHHAPLWHVVGQLYFLPPILKLED